ncbi:DUF5988 family protein [Actinomycetes bacterium KLBMP 9797]
MTTVEPNAVLRGGPMPQLDDGQRLCCVDATDTVLKLPRGGYYDHFRVTPERVRHDGRELRVFEWSHRTYVAE